MRMKAVVFTAPREVEVREMDGPEPTAEEAVVRVTHSWISNGTEGSFLRGERIAGDTPRRAGDPQPFPIVAGYQKIGVVERVGSQIGDLSVGETVFCALGRTPGMFAEWGGHVSPSVSPRRMIYKLPRGVDALAYSGLVLTQVGYNCGTRAPMGAGDGAVVVGDGMVGLWAAQTLQWRGARVALVGRHGDRLSRFSARGGRVIDAGREDWVGAVKGMFPGGVEVGVDTVGSRDAMRGFLGLMRRGGHIVSAGFYGAEDGMGLQEFRNGELSLDFVSGWTAARMEATIARIAGGDLETLPLITHRFPVDRAADAWRTIFEKRENALGVILDWE